MLQRRQSYDGARVESLNQDRTGTWNQKALETPGGLRWRGVDETRL